jgi:Tol biopolymer transport system component
VASASEAPQLAISKIAATRKSLQSSIELADESGRGASPLYRTTGKELPFPTPFGVLAWFPDGDRLVFSGVVGTQHQPAGSSPRTRLFVLTAPGGRPQALPGTDFGVDPVVSPDGTAVAFARERRRFRANRHGGETEVYRGTSTWVLALASGTLHQVTPVRNGLSELPSSFSPDGRSLLVTRREGRKFSSDLLSVAISSGDGSVIARGASDGIYSPDGSRIAFLRGHERTFTEGGSVTTVTLTDLFVMSVAGSGLHRLTNTPQTVEFAPSWDPSGSRLAFTRLGDIHSEASLFGFGATTVEVNPDGSCETTLPGSGSNAGIVAAAWRPGPGRAAGPLSC